MRHLIRAAAVLLVSACLATPAAAQGLQEGQTYGSWGVNCQNGAAAGKCQLVQQITNSQSGEPVLLARVASGKNQNGQQAVQMMIIAPLGVLLPKGMALTVDDGESARVPFLQCRPNGCHTVVTLEPDGLNTLKAGQTLNVQMTMPNGQDVSVPVSLTGFTAGIDALQAQ